ncbi:MAG: alpha/beta-type small acid-soluble spore protein [Clostridia bacterium]|nr:alpha/beta-type small acid-soluble spore protein [Clostridia bacterium]
MADKKELSPEVEEGLDKLKEDVLRDLDLADDVKERGWENMTTREAGKVGGTMVRRLVRKGEEHLARKSERPGPLGQEKS